MLHTLLHVAARWNQVEYLKWAVSIATPAFNAKLSDRDRVSALRVLVCVNDVDYAHV